MLKIIQMRRLSETSLRNPAYYSQLLFLTQLAGVHLKKATSLVTFVGTVTVNRFARAWKYPEYIGSAQRRAGNAKQQQIRQQVGRRAARQT